VVSYLARPMLDDQRRLALGTLDVAGAVLGMLALAIASPRICHLRYWGGLLTSTLT